LELEQLSKCVKTSGGGKSNESIQLRKISILG